MSYILEYSKLAEKTLAKYKKSNPIAFIKCERLLKEITDHPRTGTGHPKPLVQGNSIRYSRHISGEDVLIYNVYDDTVTVLVVSAEGHYDDK